MKQLIILSILVSPRITLSQDLNEQIINSNKEKTLQEIEKYECYKYVNDYIETEDSKYYDTIYYYSKNKELKYIKKKRFYHTFYLMGDVCKTYEYFYIHGNLVHKRFSDYTFLNNRGSVSENLQEESISVEEFTNHYFQEDGTCIIEYNRRKAQGLYKDRNNLLDTVPLIGLTGWLECSDRSFGDEYEELIKIYKKQINGK